MATKKTTTEELGDSDSVLKEFRLPNKKIYIKPIIKKGRWLDPTHSGNFMYDNTKLTLSVPLHISTGQLVDPLTAEEREFFEDKRLSGLDFKEGDLSVYKKENKITGDLNYWLNFEYRIHKNQGVVQDDTVLAELNLSDPMDYIKYKVCLTNSLPGGMVAPSWNKRFDQGTYRIVLVDADVEDDLSANEADKLSEAWAFYGTIQNSQTKLLEVLMVYWLENRKATRPPADAKIEWLKKEVSKVIKENVDGFLNLIKSNYEEKLLINTAVKYGAIQINGKFFQTADGVPLGESLRDVILFYRDERHSEQKMKLIAQIEAFKNKE